MAKNFQWRTEVTYIEGGYEGEPHGVDPADTGWRTELADGTQHSMTATYYYVDTNSPTPTTDKYTNSSLVEVLVTETFSATTDNRNNLTVTVNTIINSIKRTVYGTPGAGTPGREITIRRESGGANIWTGASSNIATSATLATNINVGTESFTLAPGGDYERSSIWYKNHTIGYPDQSPYIDVIGMGVRFKNILPADYRPGKTWNGSAWMSHNRASGAANIRGGSSNWIEMRTIGDGTMTNNPPYMRHNDGWRDMRLIGQE